MNSTNVKQWVVYDAKDKVFLTFTHEEFKNFLLDRPVKLKDKQIWNEQKRQKIWIDGILNSEFFK